MKWQRLTDVQREAFGKLAKQFIVNRGKSYDRLYDDFVRVTDNMWIDKTYLPTRATTQLYSTQSTPTAPKITNPFTSGFTIPAIWWVVASFYTPKQ